MEVASPLPFGHSQARTKRRFQCSPIVDAATGMEVASEDYAMDDSSGYGRTFKRRRFGSSENTIEMNQSSSLASASSFVAMPFASAQFNRSSGTSWKRQRTDESSSNCSLEKQMQQTIDKQSADIERLTTEKITLVNSYNELKVTNDKALNENRILKKAVTIQKERQNQADSELNAARTYKGEADDKIKKYEQIIMTLRYHLHAQQPCAANDFMGNRPPDVF